jgi:hypothetical protein
MYLDHRVIAKISSLLAKISMNVMLLDNNGQVILPEDNNREFTLPEALRQNPTAPMSMALTLSAPNGAPTVSVLPGDSQTCPTVPPVRRDDHKLTKLTAHATGAVASGAPAGGGSWERS